MPDISQLTSELHGLPDQALQQQLQQPSGMIPSYLVLAEAQRRQSMRQAAQQQQAQGSSSTVLQDVVRNMMAGQPPPGIAPAGMTPPKNGGAPTPGGMPTPTPPQPPPTGMRRGGRYAEGGEADDDSGDDGIEGTNVPIPSALGSRLLAPDPAAQSLVNRAVPTKYRPSANDIDGWINKYGQKYGVDPDMGRAIMGRESQGQTDAVSPKGASGLFQLMPGTAKDMGVDPRIPEQNIEGGMKYYRKMLDQFNGDHQLALAAYNAGPAAVQHYGGVPPFKETQDYVPAILGRYQQLKQQQQPPDLASLPTESRQPTLQATAAAAPAVTATDAPAAAATDGWEDQEGQPPPSPEATPQAPQAAPQIAPSAPASDPYSPANIQRMRATMDAIEGVSPEYKQQLAQTRAATIQQLRGLQQEQLARYHNPSPWEFLSSIAAGMGQSKSLNVAGAFGEGVGHAWQVRDQQQQQALTNADALQQRIDAVQNTGEAERGREAGQLATMLAKPPQGAAEFEKFLPYGQYGRQDQPPGANFAFKADPASPGFGVWVRTDQPLKPGKMIPALDDKTRDYYVTQVQHDVANWSLVPAEWKPQVGQALAATGVDVKRLDAAQRELQQPQDPKTVAYLADQVQQDQKNWSMTTGNKGLQNAVRTELANRGVNVTQLDASIRQTAQFAQTVQPHIQTIYKTLDTIDPDKLGPIFGRWNEFLAGKFGSGDAEYVVLRNNINLLDSALARIHGGARGGSSPPMIEYMHSMLSAGPKDAATMRAGLNVFNDWIKGYAGMAPQAGALSPSAAQPARPGGIPGDAAAQYNPATKQWRYKPQGSDSWTILQQPQQ